MHIFIFTYQVDPTLETPENEPVTTVARPPIVYTSPSAFLSSFWARFKSLWTRRFTLSLLFGQVVSLCITCTNVTTTELVQRNWANATTQTFFLWVDCRMALGYVCAERLQGIFRYLWFIHHTRCTNVRWSATLDKHLTNRIAIRWI